MKKLSAFYASLRPSYKIVGHVLTGFWLIWINWLLFPAKLAFPIMVTVLVVAILRIINIADDEC